MNTLGMDKSRARRRAIPPKIRKGYRIYARRARKMIPERAPLVSALVWGGRSRNGRRGAAWAVARPEVRSLGSSRGPRSGSLYRSLDSTKVRTSSIRGAPSGLGTTDRIS